MAYDIGTARGVIELEYNGRGVAQAQNDLDTVTQKGELSQQAMRKAGTGFLVAGGAIAAGVGLAVNSAANFEQRMSAVAAVSGATQKEMDALSAKALQLGKDTQFSASESASAIEELVKAGLSVEDVLNGAADATVNLAAAGSVSMPEAATIASNAMNQFNLTAESMVGVVDSIAGAANASAIDVGDFGQSLQQVGAVAHLAGVDFDDTATAIALMGNAGIKGSDAGTSLKSMFQRLQPTTEKQAGLFRELGILTLNNSKAFKDLNELGIKPASKSYRDIYGAAQKYFEAQGVGAAGTAQNTKAVEKYLGQLDLQNNAFYDAEGNLKSMSEVAGVLQGSLKGMTAQQKQATLQTLFGSDAIRSAAVLANAGSKGFDKMATSMGKVSAADVAKKKMDNFKGSLEQLKGSLETAGIMVGTVFIPALRAMVDAFTDALNLFLGFPSGVQAFIGILAAVVGVILLVVGAILKFMAIQKALQLALAETRLAFIATWFAALGPIALVIAAIAAVAIVIAILWKKSETFRDIVTGAWNAVKGAVSAVADWFTGTLVPAMAAVWDGVTSGVGAMGDAIGAVWSAIVTVVQTFVGVIATIIKTYVTIWYTIITTALNLILGVWRAVWGVFGGVITAAFQLIVAIIKLALVLVAAIIYAGFLAVKALTEAIWGAIVAIFQAVWGVISAIVKREVAGVQAIIGAAWGAIKAVTSAVWNAVMSVISAVWGRIGGTVMGAVNSVKSVITNAWNAVKSATTTIWNGLAGAVGTAINAVMDKVRTIYSRVTGFFSGAGTWLLNAGKAIIQGLLDGIEAMIGKVTEKITSLTNKVKSFLPGSPVKEGPLRVLNHGYAGKQIVQMIADGMGDPAAVNAMQDMATMIAAAATPTAVPTVSEPVSSPNPQPVGGKLFDVNVTAPQRMSPEEVGEAVGSRVAAAVFGRGPVLQTVGV